MPLAAHPSATPLLRRARTLLAVAGLAALGAGCAPYRLPVVTHPVGASVSVDTKHVGVAPMDAPVPLLGRTDVLVELSGYRPLHARLGLFRPRAIELLLVPEHGGAGTWDPALAK